MLTSTNTLISALRDGRFVYTMISGGKQRLGAVQPGSLPRVLLETAEESSSPAAPVGDSTIAFMIGSGDAKRLGLASLRDGRVLRRYAAANVTSLMSTPDGRDLYYSSNAGIWSQPVSGGEPRRITDGTDAALDPTGRFLYVKRTSHGTIELFRVPAAGGEGEKIVLPPEYQLAEPSFPTTAIDKQGRVLVSVLSAHSFYYRPAIYDPARKSLSVIPVVFDGDVSAAGWTSDGRLYAYGSRYVSSLWRYRPMTAAAVK